VKFADELQRKHDIRIKGFGHAGDGNLHIYVLRDELEDKEWKKKLDEVFKLLYDKAGELGGKVSGEHGIGYIKKPFLKESEGSEVIGLIKGIKLAFDPKNILNPGKIS